ncbi:prepilin-type N-terminal cleavage/methylation domain-containing protein [Alteromonas sp. ASW11-36]|uniref:Prepilin-type N-terminal cleavage/methylation domain-containing protein n=1 Tax=Alteromonas arenosi TaxID=3055817 RepID=A0ABT7SXF7_9ALTE|nr:prepilin-type N-terminal cleavage/methylation domain-containing protein [Alteromonas sp. ASW11-36]MDM7860850.1 prepilin-type N-terminal cleavage/methylation domain-containing protein [Alteromonas sp. ASW11-36]
MVVKSQRNGFTLIELILVIVIIGVLAVIAAPRFIDLSGDANAAVMKNMEGNLETSLNLILAKKAIQRASSTVDYGGDTIVLQSGFPQPDASQLRYWLNTSLPSTTFTADRYTVPCDLSDFCVVGNRPASEAPVIPGLNSGTKLYIWPKGYVLDACFAYYGNPDDGSLPVIGAITTGC